MNRKPAIWGPSLAASLPVMLSSDRDQINEEICRLRSTTKGLTPEVLESESSASQWLIAALYQGYCSHPKQPVALPRSRGAYSTSMEGRIPLPYAAATRALSAGDSLGFIEIELGFQGIPGKGSVTRISPAGRLKEAFEQIGVVWVPSKPPNRESLILIGEGGGKSEYQIVPRDYSPQVAGWQDALARINDLLANTCIFLDLPDKQLTQVGEAISGHGNTARNSQSGTANAGTGINFSQTALRRIFSRHRLDHGGRLYGGWWQQVPSRYRRHIIIEDHLTVEVDYSGIALRCIYAMEGIPLDDSDPYDIGLNYTKGDVRRKLVKKFINAAINDESGRYKLRKAELSILGISHRELVNRVAKKHAPIAKHFHTGVGLKMQFVDSEIAMGVLSHLADLGEVCLPVHDSFIVRAGLVEKLQEIMREEFWRVTGVPCPVVADTVITGERMYMPKPKDGLRGMDAVIDYLNAHFEQFSTAQGYLASWYEHERLNGYDRLAQDFNIRDLRSWAHGLQPTNGSA